MAASLHANVPALLSCFSLGYFLITSTTETSFSLLIDDAFIEVLLSGRGLSLLVGGGTDRLGVDGYREEHGSDCSMCGGMDGGSIPDVGEKVDEGINDGGG